MFRFARAARKLGFELEETLAIYAENFGDMHPEDWAAGDWFDDGPPDDGREDWIER